MSLEEHDERTSVRLKLGNDAYSLLRSYAKESKILALAYHKSEVYYRKLFKIFNYPVVILSATTTVCAGMDINQYILLSLSLSTLILLGFDKLIDPKEKEHEANKFSVEYGEISGNIKQFIMSNDRTTGEVKAYSETMYSLLAKWKTMNPSLRDKFTKEARTECLPKMRDHKMSLRNVYSPSPLHEKKRLSLDFPITEVEDTNLSPTATNI